MLEDMSDDDVQQKVIQTFKINMAIGVRVLQEKVWIWLEQNDEDIMQIFVTVKTGRIQIGQSECSTSDSCFLLPINH